MKNVNMKRLFAFLMCVLVSTCAMAQAKSAAPLTDRDAFTVTGQLVNLSNSIAGATNDTANNAATIYLTLAKWSSTGVPSAFGLMGNGSLSVVVNGVKITGTPAGTIRLEESPDGVHWGPCPSGAFVDAVDTILNVATVQKYTFSREVKLSPFYRAAITTIGTQSSSWQAWLCFTRRQQYTTSK